MKFQKQIDNWLQSIWKSALAVFLLCMIVITALCLLGWLITGKFDILNWLLVYVNPGSTEATNDPYDRIYALIIGLFGMVFLTGAFVSAITNIIQLRKDNVNEGKIHYRFSGHIIVLGYNNMCVSLIRQICDKYPDSEIVLQTVQKVPDIRHELYANLSPELAKRVTIIAGNRSSKEDLKNLYPQKCKTVFLLGETGEYDHDTLNIKCLESLVKIYKELRIKAIGQPCHVLFESQSTYTVFQQQDIPNLKEYFNFLPFNFHECWAQKVLVDGKFQEITYPFLDRDGITADSNQHVHFVVVGMSQMGVAMGIQAAHICHFPNFITQGIKTKITFIDENAEQEMLFLQGRYRHLFEEVDYKFWNINTGEERNNFEPKTKFTDLEFEFIQGRIENPVIQKKLTEWATEKDTKRLTIAICFSQSPAAIAAGLYLPDEIYDNHIPVFVRQETSDCTLSLLSSGKYKNVKPFGMLEDAYDLGKTEEELPMRVNYVHDYFYRTETDRKLPDAIPENEMKANWHKLSTALKWSNRFNANMIEVKIRSLANSKTLDEQIDTLAQIEHNRWCIEKLFMGYRQITDRDKAKGIDIKTLKEQYFVHTDICAFSDLPKEKQDIDRILSKALYLIKG